MPTKSSTDLTGLPDDLVILATVPIQNETLIAQNSHLVNLLTQAGLDASARKAAEKIQQVLIDELHHRMKNMLTMVIAIVRQSMRGAKDVAAVDFAINTRLVAMARAHDLLLTTAWQNAQLRDIAKNATEQHNTIARRIAIEGDDMRVVSSVVLPLTLALNELCTNAIKYGALSRDGGGVRLSWAVDAANNQFVLRWVEEGGPHVSPPSSKSLGMRLIEHALPSQLGGSAKLTFLPSGAVFELVAPLDRVQVTSAGYY